jgi:exodeoxyribonuclease V alpha subunit
VTTETLDGSVERITYYNEENGYTVLRLRPKDTQGLRQMLDREGFITVVGNFPALQPGEMVKFEGSWANHTQYGKQFSAKNATPVLPNTADGIRRYLGSGIIKNVGKRTADQIVDHFGEDTIRVLDQTPERLSEVPGLRQARIALIIQSWAENSRLKSVMVFLQGQGIGTSLAMRIVREYGDQTIAKVRQNPYQLARDIRNIGFKTADRIARSLGLPADSPERIEAGILYALDTLLNDGHVYAPRLLITERVIDLLALQSDDDAAPPADEDDAEAMMLNSPYKALIDTAISALHNQDEIVIENVPDPSPQAALDADTGSPVKIEAIYLRPMFLSEKGAARKIRDMLNTPTTRLHKAKNFGWVKFFSLLGSHDRIKLSLQQQAAVEAALANKISVLTGGPGTGKTTTLRAVIKALETLKVSYELASPTGRAAKRLAEATGRPARTLHRLLGFSPEEGGFQHNEDEPLQTDMLIVDEASMLDLTLFYSLLKALTPDMHLMLVGDIDQLPSVGAGDILRDVIASGVAHITRLNVIFRQADDSQIVANAHRINQGEMPVLDNQSSDFFMFNADSPEAAADLVVDVVRRRIPERFNYDPLNEIQVLAPMYKGGVGIQVLNEKLQAALNPPGRMAERKFNGQVYRVGDKVMQTKNNYEKDVYNGDIGRISAIDFAEETILVSVDERDVEYTFSDMDELVHAYAVTVHKSQGSEYPVVVMVVMPQHHIMLQRNLLYTGVTRAKKMVVLVGAKRAVAIAVNNAKVADRYTALDWRLAKAIGRA